MADPDRTDQDAVEPVEAIEASREAYVTEALLEAVRGVVALYRSEGGGLPVRVGALDRLAAAYESYTRVFAAAEAEAERASAPPPP
jgi:hypothetical protein